MTYEWIVVENESGTRDVLKGPWTLVQMSSITHFFKNEEGYCIPYHEVISFKVELG